MKNMYSSRTKRLRRIKCQVSIKYYFEYETRIKLTNVVVEVVGLNFFGLFHKLSAPPCRNQGGNGLLVVVAKTLGAQAK